LIPADNWTSQNHVESVEDDPTRTSRDELKLLSFSSSAVSPSDILPVCESLGSMPATQPQGAPFG